MKTLSKIDWDIIDARVASAKDLHSLPTQSIGLLTIVLEQLFPNISDQLQEAITDGSDDRGIDAIHVIEGETQAEVYIFQSKYRSSHKSCDRTINDAEILKISLFLNEVFEKSESLLSCNNFRLSEAVQRIWELHKKGKICRYRVIFCSNGNGFSQSAQKIISSVCDGNHQISFEFYGAGEIIRGMTLERRSSENGSLQVIGKEILERSDGDVRGIIASVDARSFIELIQTDDRNGIKRHLFDDNLRVFLGAKGGFNPSIINTATSSDSYLFWYLNNGITITCKKFSYNKGHTNPTLQFEDFQIVNGAQTSHSLVEASRTGAEALQDVVLMVRVYATDRADIAERVAVATNSQARIQSRDLRANHNVLKKLELAFQEKGYYFERKKNMAIDKPEERRIDALKLGQILLAFELRAPDRAKSESDSIFDSRFDQIYHDSRNVTELVNVFELYRIIEKLRDRYISEYGQSHESGHAHQYLIYGHWFVLFTCHLLMLKTGSHEIPVGKKAEELVEEAIAVVASACSQQKAVAHYQMFRSGRTIDKIYAELHGKQLNLLDLLAAND
ncbi:AIPR family protein [Roseibium sp.]|uniref:AIPR family protein n=1 Tax=Roseibium sp. TaxID=1936156 RepID=UPI003A9843A9